MKISNNGDEKKKAYLSNSNFDMSILIVLFIHKYYNKLHVCCSPQLHDSSGKEETLRRGKIFVV